AADPELSVWARVRPHSIRRVKARRFAGRSGTISLRHHYMHGRRGRANRTWRRWRTQGFFRFLPVANETAVELLDPPGPRALFPENSRPASEHSPALFLAACL